jgi:hypothetical protein
MKIQAQHLAYTAGAASLMLLLNPGSAKALVTANGLATINISVDDKTYKVSPFSGSYEANSAKFNSPDLGGVMPWWEDEALASKVFDAVAADPASAAWRSAYGLPYVAYSKETGIDLDSGEQFTYILGLGSAFGSGASEGIFANGLGVFPWLEASPQGRATAVPGPVPLFGAAAAFGWSRRLRRRITIGS